MNEYNPDYVSPPGESIKELMEDRGIDDLYIDNLHLLLEGTMIIDESLAEWLEMNLGGTKSFWLNRERLYREFKNRSLI